MDRFQRSLEVITGLFFEEATLSFMATEEAEVRVTMDIQQGDRLVVSGTLQHEHGRTYEAYYARSWKTEEEKGRMKQVKHAVSYIYLSLMQQYTDFVQQWGILTGVRPVKLLHQKLRSGLTREEAHRELRIRSNNEK